MSKRSSNQKLDEASDLIMQPLDANPDKYYKNKVRINLRKIIKKAGKKKILRCSPIFNTDGLPYTPAFIIQSDKQIYEILQQVLKNQYFQKILKTQELSTNLIQDISLKLNPNFQSKICFVCKNHYLDYAKHINQLNHKHKIHQSDYTWHIENLCSQYSGAKKGYLSEDQQQIGESSEDKQLELGNFFKEQQFYQQLPYIWDGQHLKGLLQASNQLNIKLV